MKFFRPSLFVLWATHFSTISLAADGTIPPVATDAEIEYRLVGEVAATRKSQLAFKVGGFIESISAKPGDAIKKGVVLATLDQRDFKLKLDLARTRRVQAKIALESADKELQREIALKQENASTEASYDKVKSAQEQAMVALQLADLDLKAAENSFKDSKLQAPYDCVVASQLKFEGETVQSGNGAFEVFDVVNPEITLRAPERLLGQIKVGEVISVKVPSAGFVGAAEIVRIVSIVNEKTRTFSLTAHFKKSDSNLVPGLYAEGTIKKLVRSK